MAKANAGAAKVVGDQPGGFARALTAASVAAQEAHHKDVRDKLIELQGKSTSTAAAYDNAVMLAGFVAFFALWSGIQESLTPVCRLVTVALMGISLMCYLGWQILQMLTRQWFDWKLVGAFKQVNDPPQFNALWLKISQDHEIATAKLMRFWPWLFIPSLAFGFAGGIVLTYNALAIVLGWPQLTG